MTDDVRASAGNSRSSLCGAGVARGRWRGTPEPIEQPIIDEVDLCAPRPGVPEVAGLD